MLNQTEYIDGVHCGDKNCYACATQRYNCNKLNELDAKNKGLEADLEAQDYDIFGENKI
jgi:hypothetical protein